MSSWKTPKKVIVRAKKVPWARLRKRWEAEGEGLLRRLDAQLTAHRSTTDRLQHSLRRSEANLRTLQDSYARSQEAHRALQDKYLRSQEAQRDLEVALLSSQGVVAELEGECERLREEGKGRDREAQESAALTLRLQETLSAALSRRDELAAEVVAWQQRLREAETRQRREREDSQRTENERTEMLSRLDRHVAQLLAQATEEEKLMEHSGRVLGYSQSLWDELAMAQAEEFKRRQERLLRESLQRREELGNSLGPSSSPSRKDHSRLFENAEKLLYSQNFKH